MKVISDNIKPLLALLVVLMGFGYFFTTTLSDIKPNDQVLIAIVSLMTGAMGYYFGASTGTAKKDETINNLIEKQKNDI